MDRAARDARAQLVAALAGWPEIEPETKALLRRLPWRQRQAVTMVLGDHTDAGLVAVILGVSESTIRRDLRAAAWALFGPGEG